MPKQFIYTKKGRICTLILDVATEEHPISLHRLICLLANLDEFTTNATKIDAGLGWHWYKLYQTRTRRILKELKEENRIRYSDYMIECELCGAFKAHYYKK